MMDRATTRAKSQHLFTHPRTDGAEGLAHRARIHGRAPRSQGARGRICSNLLDGPLSAEIEMRTKGQGFVGNGHDSRRCCPSSKRDNGILAMDFDLFAVAQEEPAGCRRAAAQRSYGPFLSRQARTRDCAHARRAAGCAEPSDRRAAISMRTAARSRRLIWNTPSR